MTTAVNPVIRLKTVAAQLEAWETMILMQLRNMSPIRGVLEVGNTGTKAAQFWVTVMHEKNSAQPRQLACAHLQLEPGQSEDLVLQGVLMPGEIVIYMGDGFNTLQEVLRTPSPAGKI